MRNRLLSSLLFVILVFISEQMAGSNHQTVIIPFRQTFSFSLYPDSSKVIINQFLLKIAEGSNKLRAYTSYHFFGHLEAAIEKDTEGECIVRLRYLDTSFSGDFVYKDFSLERMLLPDLVSFRMNLYAADGQDKFSQTFGATSIMDEGEVILATNSLVWCDMDFSRTVFSDIEFLYSRAIFERFESWVASLDEYYKSKDVLLRLPEAMDGISYDDPETLILNEFRLCEAEEILSQARGIFFSRWLNLQNGDPEGFLPLFNQYVDVLDSLRRIFNHKLAYIDDLLYAKALDMSAAGSHENAKELCMQALIYNPLHVSSNLMLAGYDLDSLRLTNALERITIVVSTMFPAGDLKVSSDSLALRTLNTIFDIVSELIVEKRFLDALTWLAKVQDFCDQTDGLYECPDILRQLQVISHWGMFHSFMTVSERAYRNENLSLCLTYLRSAVEYQSEYADFINDRSMAEDLLRRLINHHRKLGNTKQLMGDPDEALKHFEVMHEICETFLFLNCSR